MGTKKQSKLIPKTQVKGLGEISAGKLVSHPLFGNGEVVEIAKWESGEVSINVMFSDYGSKWLVPEFANLSDISKSANKTSKKGFLNRLFGK